MKKAFTLAEVLITLGIIGVVSAITISTLVQKYQEKVLVESLKQTYSIFSQAYLMAINENGNPEYWDIGSRDTVHGANKLYDIIVPHLKRAKDCKTKTDCFATNYKSLFGESYIWQPMTHSVYSRGVLENGTSFLFWSGGTGCKTDNICGTLKVDVNGLKNPNRAGVDFFSFRLMKDGSINPTYSSTPLDSYGEFCKYNDTSNKNGVVCTGWVITHGNMDYLRRDVSNE
jgi:prepilin-type N-terminal cleavage/methylation domain-containing protein